MSVKIKSVFTAVLFFCSFLVFGCIGSFSPNRVYLNQRYGSHPRQRYALVLPENAKGSTGLVLNIHGGAWKAGDYRGYFSELFKISNECGVAAAAINYRYISDDSGFEEIMEDISLALGAIKERCSLYGADIDRVILTGGSAGAHLSLLYAYSMADTAPVKPVAVLSYAGPTSLTDSMFYEPDSALADAMGGVDGVCELFSAGIQYSFTSADLGDENVNRLLEKYSPVSYVNENTVPTIICHGEQDTVVPYSNAVLLDKALTDCGVEHVFISFPNSGHGCEDPESKAYSVELEYEYIARFLS